MDTAEGHALTIATTNVNSISSAGFTSMIDKLVEVENSYKKKKTCCARIEPTLFLLFFFFFFFV